MLSSGAAQRITRTLGLGCQKTVPEYLAPSSRESPAEFVFMGLVATFQWQITRLSNCLGNDPKRL
jgi:hypothetical protein